MMYGRFNPREDIDHIPIFLTTKRFLRFGLHTHFSLRLPFLLNPPIILFAKSVYITHNHFLIFLVSSNFFLGVKVIRTSS